MNQTPYPTEKQSNQTMERMGALMVADFIFLALLLVFSGFWAWRQFMISPPYVSPERYPIRGIDVSAHNGMMNLDAAAHDGIEFVFIKASEGGDFKDENFRINYEKARQAGLKTGAYHFFRFDTDGISQALNLVEAIGNRDLDLGIAIDVESAGNPEGIPERLIQERLSSMVDYLILKGYRVMFYTNRQGYYDHVKNSFEGFPLWICSFSSTPISTEWTFWQYNHHGKVKGIKGEVDLNAYCGSRSEWLDFLVGVNQPEHSETQ